MADVFISYSKPHVELTRDLASDLEAKGLTVWWDTDLLAGESFRQRIIQELHDCKAAIVIWTPQSVSSDYVISEAERARKAGKLIQVRTDEVEPDQLPPPFDTGHASLIDDRKAIYGAWPSSVCFGARAQMCRGRCPCSNRKCGRLSGSCRRECSSWQGSRSSARLVGWRV
jgi:TIR domain